MKKNDEVVVDSTSFIYVNWDIKSFLVLERFTVEKKLFFTKLNVLWKLNSSPETELILDQLNLSLETELDHRN
jgi:hypothetical protein